VGVTPPSQQISLDGQVLWDAVRQASIHSDVSILGIAQGHNLTFVALNGANLVISWRFRLPMPAGGSSVFLIPPMIAGHLLTALPQIGGPVDLTLNRHEASLTAHDEVGRYELRWRYDLHGFPAPPGMSNLLEPPSTLIRLTYLDLADSIHQAVAKLGAFESQQPIHRTKLAIQICLSDGRLIVDGQEIGDQAPSVYYFDPRLLVRALECVRTAQVEVGLSQLDSQRGYLSLVDHQPDCVMHCTLLSISLNMPWLAPLPSGRKQVST
jgi:hypothetical protein